MQNLTEQEVIDYARQRHNIPPAYAKSWFQYWTNRNWVTTTGRLILNWRVKFDWWVLDHKDHLILTETPPAQPTPAELYQRELRRQREEREEAERIYLAEQAEPASRGESASTGVILVSERSSGRWR